MDKEKFNKIKTLSDRYGLKNIQNIWRLSVDMEKLDLKPEDIKEYIDIELDKINTFNKTFKNADNLLIQKCPKCNTNMRVAPIHEPKGKANKFGYKSVWVCDNEKCDYYKYSKKTIPQLLNKALLKKDKRSKK